MKLLLVEDEQDLQDVLHELLSHQGYTVDAVGNGQDALDRTRADVYDAIVMDVMMPVMDGLTALKTMRADGCLTPVLMLTAKAGLNDRIEGLDAGADDYLPKPFALGELLARIRALTRRGAQYKPTVLTLRDVSLDTGDCVLSARNLISLAWRETRLMEMFMRNPGRPMGREEILARVWADAPATPGETVHMYVMFLTGKLRSIGAAAHIEEREDGSCTLVEGEA